MPKTLKDRLTGPVPPTGDKIWQQLPQWLAAAAPLPKGLFARLFG